MKIKFLLVCCSLMNLFNVKSQINLYSFTKSLIEKSQTLKQEREDDINIFMKYGYKKNPDLKDKEIRKIPVYTIFSKSKFTNSNRAKDSLFVYLNLKSLCIDNILFYKEERFVAVAYSRYLNVKDQPIGMGNALTAKLAKIVIKENPEILFSLSQSNKIYFFLKDNLLFCYYLDENRDDFIRMNPKDFLEKVDDFEFQFMTHLDKFMPLIYSN